MISLYQSATELVQTFVLIFESLLMTCAKNCKKWWMCVKAIASQTGDIFGHCV